MSLELRIGAGVELLVDGVQLSTGRDVEGFRALELELRGVVLVIGLGLGGTVRELLDRHPVERLVVVEQLAEVLELFVARWPVSAADPRLELVVGTWPDVHLELEADTILDDRGPTPRIVKGEP